MAYGVGGVREIGQSSSASSIILSAGNAIKEAMPKLAPNSGLGEDEKANLKRLNNGYQLKMTQNSDPTDCYEGGRGREGRTRRRRKEDGEEEKEEEEKEEKK